MRWWNVNVCTLNNFHLISRHWDRPTQFARICTLCRLQSKLFKYSTSNTTTVIWWKILRNKKWELNIQNWSWSYLHQHELFQPILIKYNFTNYNYSKQKVSDLVVSVKKNSVGKMVGQKCYRVPNKLAKFPPPYQNPALPNTIIRDERTKPNRSRGICISWLWHLSLTAPISSPRVSLIKITHRRHWELN